MAGFFSTDSWNLGAGQKQTLPKCGQCGLCGKCISPKMGPTGSGTRSILVVAEAPGETEDRQGEQLVGEAGQLLRRLLRRNGDDLEDCTKTNAAICRPPKNKIEDVHIESCRPNLIATIKNHKPTVIVLLGISAVKALIPTEWKKGVDALGKWVGWTIPSHTHGAWICPTYHPSFLVRSQEDETLCRIVQEHLKRAFQLESVPLPSTTLEDLKAKVEIVESTRLAQIRMEELARAEGILAFDYETTGLKPEAPGQEIVSCSFCLNGRDTFAFEFTPTLADVLRRVLSSPRLKKVASNLKFEDRWTRRKLGLSVSNWYWDTMQAAHVIDNRPGITSVKFQSYVFFGVGDYDSHVEAYLKARNANGLNRIRELDKKTLLTYNGLDSLLEYKVMKRQQRILGFE